MQRSDQRERTSSSFTLDDDATEATEGNRGGRLAGVRGRLGRLFSVKTFLLALVLAGVGVVAGGAVPVVGFVGRFVGLFLAAFAIGVLTPHRRYLEVGLAGAFAAALGFVLGTLGSAFFPFAVRLLADYGVGIAGVGALSGLLVSLAGHYFGRDLRDGLTREV